MQLNSKPTGLAMSIPGALTLSGVLALILTLISSAILAKMVEIQRIPEQNIGYGVMGLLVVVSFVCAILAAGKVKHQRLLVCISSGAVYWGILLAITALFFGGQYEAVGETGLMILCGSGAAALLGLRRGNGSIKRKKGHGRH